MQPSTLIGNFVEANATRLIALSDAIWETPELGFRVEKSAGAIAQALEAEGFRVESGLAGIPTAFRATWGAGKPVIGFLGEYDALPNLSQRAGLAAQEELTPGGNGHGCGHNLLGVGALAAAAALKNYMEKQQLAGTVVYMGCPGEEFGSGKAFMARAGCFDLLDCAFSWHPNMYTCVWGFGSLAHLSVLFDFKGVPAHASSAPHNGRSALDAAELMNVGVNFLREHIIPEARIHYAFHDAGGRAPNVVQDRARLHYYIRAPKIAQVQEIFQRVQRVAGGAAMMTDTQVSVTVRDGMSDFMPNRVLTAALEKAMGELGPGAYSQEEYRQAKAFRQAIPDSAYRSALEELASLSPTGAEAYAGKDLMDGILEYNAASGYRFPASTDVGDVSYVVPTAQLMAATSCLGTALHTWQMTAQAKTSIGHKGMLFAGKAMALAAARLLEAPQLLQKAWEEHKKAAGGPYVCPFPEEVEPSL